MLNIEKSTMTLNMPKHEMELIDKLAEDKGMSKTALMRQALRLYQGIVIRWERGEEMRFYDKAGNRTDIMPVGLGILD